VLLLGVGHEADTTVHLAENLAGVRYGIPKYAIVIEEGRRLRVDYAEVDHCCQNFSLLDEWLDAERVQRRGIVGLAQARLARSREIVRVALPRLAERETVFLHRAGECQECDEAWKSLPAAN
jgi:aminoglycoside 3-N-acetyltransferase